MGFQERWQSRQGELAARAEDRETAEVERWNEYVERFQDPILDHARLAFERGDGWFETEIDQRSRSKGRSSECTCSREPRPLRTRLLEQRCGEGRSTGLMADGGAGGPDVDKKHCRRVG
ncbi:hypothetical protein SBD_0216 [Streptomyces bottropensis ATCC 25435]|uniref:Uncharacterized protein n=1 Tax=Streptomyces bottropensis ATCC 25435 TaxID=1054862 RepID=M3FZ42_9ACTN|nr:hypothetical protein SBD_0216 [Streptomyces bottropensis ATCC 25435]